MKTPTLSNVNFFLLLVTLFFSCGENTNTQKQNTHIEEQDVISQKTHTLTKNLEKNYLDWWIYYKENIKLSLNFAPLNADSEKTSKEKFLDFLLSGNYIPIKINSTDSLPRYKLVRLSKSADNSIRTTIKSQALIAYKNHQWVGKNFPLFEFKDLEGNIYNNQNIKGKIVLIKCWFINCKACVEEFPQLNELVENYDNRDDIVFISLALDSGEDLRKFLEAKKFNYKVVPKQRKFISKDLEVLIYPTHIIVGKNGVVKKRVQAADELIYALQSLLGDKNPIKGQVKKQSLPPSPPSPLLPQTNKSKKKTKSQRNTTTSSSLKFFYTLKPI